MGLTMREKQAVTRQMATEYTKATKKQKGRILDSLRVENRFSETPTAS